MLQPYIESAFDMIAAALKLVECHFMILLKNICKKFVLFYDLLLCSF